MIYTKITTFLKHILFEGSLARTHPAGSDAKITGMIKYTENSAN